MRLTRRTLLAGAGATALAACTSTATARLAPSSVRTADPGPDATELAAMIRRKDITALEATEAAIKRAQQVNPQLNFIVNDTYDLARARAKTELKGPFAGVPWLVKDLNGVIGAKTRQGSRATAGLPPETTQTPYIDATFAAGLVCIAKSSAPEKGYLPTTEPLAFGPTRNPWDITRSTAGSSGGAACAVAAGVVPMAHANDGGGSIRFPAANCGLVGLKPSRGRLIDSRPPRPLDIAVQGCISRSVRDTAGLFAATEWTGANAPLPPIGMVTSPTKAKLKIGMITTGFTGVPANPEVRAVLDSAAKNLEGLGHAIIETKWPTAPTFADDFLLYWSLGAAADMQAFSKIIGKPVDPSTVEPFSLRMAENAAKLAPADIGGVQKRLLESAAAYDAWIKGFDVVISPVFTSPPSPLGYLRGDVPFDELRERLLHEVGYTLIHNVSGAPAISLPMGWTPSGLPVGVQVSAPMGGERILLELAYQVEAAHPWAKLRPPVWAG